MEMAETWLLAAALAVLALDCAMFVGVLFAVRRIRERVDRGMATIEEKIIAAVNSPENMEALGRGLAQSYRQSGYGKEGKDAQVTKEQEKKLFGMVLKHQTSQKLPALSMAMDFMGPDAWKYIEDNPQLGIIMLNKFGPQLNKAAEGITGKLMEAAK